MTTIRICVSGGEKSKITFGGQTQVQMDLPSLKEESARLALPNSSRHLRSLARDLTVSQGEPHSLFLSTSHSSLLIGSVFPHASRQLSEQSFQADLFVDGNVGRTAACDSGKAVTGGEMKKRCQTDAVNA